MDEFDKAVADAPWGSDLAYVQIRKTHPDWQIVGDSAGIRAMMARGWRLRAVFRNPFFPDDWAGKDRGGAMPALFYGPPTEDEQRERGIGSQLADMVRGDDLRRKGLRR